jgi:hypothetical protein
MVKSVKTLNEVYSSLATRRRYEVWFVRLGLADGAGAWWFRYLLMNPGRGGCPGNSQAMPVQVWATWFPTHGEPRRFIQGFPREGLDLSPRGQTPFQLRIGRNGIEESSCRGELTASGHTVSWDLRYRSTFRVTMSDKGWIGFSRTPHSDAVFSGQITLDGRKFQGEPLGFGLQGHNCGYRHRTFWTWAHVHFPRAPTPPSTLEALLYEMPFGLVFRKVALWHEGQLHVFRKIKEITRDREHFVWQFRCTGRDGEQLTVALDGGGPSMHRLPYCKTDCSGSFEVVNNSLARAVVSLELPGGGLAKLETPNGAVLEMTGGNP